MRSIYMNFETAEKYHVLFFPDATPEGQWIQFGEELCEMLRAETLSKAMDEYGDLLFVIVSLNRFESTRAAGRDLMQKYYFDLPPDERKAVMKRLEKAILKVSERVRKGLYENKNGLYTRKKIYSVLGD